MGLLRIAIVGAGGMAREVASAIQWINREKPQFEFVGYLVSDLSKLSKRDSREAVLGDFEWMEKHRHAVDAFAIGIGTPSVRVSLSQQLSEAFPEIQWPAIVHPSAIVDYDSAKLGEGTFVGARCVSTVNLELEPFALCNFGTTVGHETRIGRGSVVNPGANISGGVVVEEEVLIGTGAQILQYLTVGSGAKVGAGAVVTRDIPKQTTVVGIPARELKKTAAAFAVR
jgi:sugar O-acyltransferase (sialic acid O-acetyltransferase NeuD family)